MVRLKTGGWGRFREARDRMFLRFCQHIPSHDTRFSSFLHYLQSSFLRSISVDTDACTLSFSLSLSLSFATIFSPAFSNSFLSLFVFCYHFLIRFLPSLSTLPLPPHFTIPFSLYPCPILSPTMNGIDGPGPFFPLVPPF